MFEIEFQEKCTDELLQRGFFFTDSNIFGKKSVEKEISAEWSEGVFYADNFSISGRNLYKKYSLCVSFIGNIFCRPITESRYSNLPTCWELTARSSLWWFLQLPLQTIHYMHACIWTIVNIYSTASGNPHICSVYTMHKPISKLLG